MIEILRLGWLGLVLLHVPLNFKALPNFVRMIYDSGVGVITGYETHSPMTDSLFLA